MKRLVSPIALLFLVLYALCLPVRSHAAIHLPLDVALDDWPSSDWSVRTQGKNPHVAIATLQGHDWLEIGRPTSTDTGSGQVIYNGGHFDGNGMPVSSSENQLGDLKGSVILGSSSWGTYGRGVILRAQGSTFNNNASTLNAYYLAMTADGLGLYWNSGAGYLSDASVQRLAFDSFSSPLLALNATNNNQYMLDFSVIGLQFEASVWALNESGEKVGDALATLSFLDERPEARNEGYFGLRGGIYGTTTSTYFRDLNVEAIPEPSSVAFIIFGLGAGLALTLKKNGKK